MLILAFDTATDVATSALVHGGETVGERTGSPRALLADLAALLEAGGMSPADLEGVVVGTGPGSFTGTRIGLAVARGLSLSLDIGVAGVSTLDALAAALAGAIPLVDARRGEVFAPGPFAVKPEDLAVTRGDVYIGSGAVRYRESLIARGAEVPPDARLHVPHASLHASIARSFGPADAVEPVYVRAPDAKRWPG